MWKLIFAGVGGQGVVTAAILLAEAVVIHEGRHAVQTQSYGAQARGGLTRADVTVSDTEIHYPKVDQAHVLVCLHQDAYYRNVGKIRPGGILIVDEDLVTVDRNVDARTFRLPFRRIAEESGSADRPGSPQGANMVMLGGLLALTGIAEPDSLRTAIRHRFDGRAGTNLAAFEAGLTLPAAQQASLHHSDSVR